MRKISWNGVWIVLAVASAVVGIWNGRAGAGTAGEAAVAAGRILDFADEALAEDYRISLQFYGETDWRKAEALVQDMDDALGLESLDSAAGELQAAYRLMNGPGTVTFLWNEKAEEWITVVRLEGDRREAGRLLELQEALDALLEQAADNGLWSTKAEGAWRSGSSAEGVPERQVEELAGARLKAQRKAVYREGAMSHMTFTSELLPVKASKKDNTALQTSLHRDSETGNWKLAVGAPLLTGEF